MTATTIIPEQTAVVTIPAPFQVKKLNLPQTLIATNLGSNEEVDVFVSIDGGATFTAAFQNGIAVVLTDTDNVVSINSPGWFAATKDATLAASGVFVSSGEQP